MKQSRRFSMRKALSPAHPCLKRSFRQAGYRHISEQQSFSRLFLRMLICCPSSRTCSVRVSGSIPDWRYNEKSPARSQSAKWQAFVLSSVCKIVFAEGLQFGDTLGRCKPDNFKIDGAVFMGDVISHAANLMPRNICIRSPEIISQSAD